MKTVERFLLAIVVTFCCVNVAAQSGYDAKYPYDPAKQPVDESVAGEVLEFRFTNSKIYPGTERSYWIYIPKAYKGDKPACLYVCMDDILFKATTVFDNLIATGEMPVTIGVFVGPGKIERNGKFLLLTTVLFVSC